MIHCTMNLKTLTNELDFFHCCNEVMQVFRSITYRPNEDFSKQTENKNNKIQIFERTFLLTMNLKNFMA